MPTKSPPLGKAERKYLERYAEPEAAGARALAESEAPHAAAVVIPAYGETESLLRTLASVPPCRTGTPLIVLVINQRDDSPRWAHDANRSVLAALRSTPARETPIRALCENVQRLRYAGHELVVIDRSAPGKRLPARQGVGLARKIGADFALALWASGGSQSPWIHCTDADVSLPADYFDRSIEALTGKRAAAGASAPAALVYDFRHAIDDAHDAGKAILQYEIFLRYYVLGLRSAGSVHAFHTIGSTLAIDARAYAQVRGFPKLDAAEDFHLLAKLTKVGRVEPLRGEPIVLSGRESERVPFGTGHAVLQGRARARRGEAFAVYDPRNFAWLAVWLETLDSLAQRPSSNIPQLLEAHASSSEVDAAQLARILEKRGAIENAMKALRKRGDRRRSLNESFDALATLQLIHALAEQVHPVIPLERALESAPFIAHDPSASVEAQRSQLAKLEVAG